MCTCIRVCVQEYKGVEVCISVCLCKWVCECISVGMCVYVSRCPTSLTAPSHSNREEMPLYSSKIIFGYQPTIFCTLRQGVYLRSRSRHSQGKVKWLC